MVRLSSESGDEAAWAAVTQRAVVLAEGRRTRRPGVVQLNAEFAEPLLGELPAPRPRGLRVARSAGHEVVELGARRTVVLAGDAPPSVGAEARALAEVSGAPLLAEPSSNARAGSNAVPDYRARLAELGERIETVVCFGHPTLSRPVTQLLSRADLELVVVASQATWPDPGHRAAIIADRVMLADQDPAWLAAWFAHPERSLSLSKGPESSLSPERSLSLSKGPESSLSSERSLSLSKGFTHQAVVDTVLAASGPDDDLVLGASSIIRAADLAPIQARPPRVFANRGLSGIDGTISTATGMALASGRPTTVLLGDLTAQHDLGALVRPPSEPWPRLRVVVADDGGGSIFAGLEQGAPEYAESFERVFRTPQNADLAAVAAALGWRAVRAQDAEALGSALASDAEFIVASLG